MTTENDGTIGQLARTIRARALEADNMIADDAVSAKLDAIVQATDQLLGEDSDARHPGDLAESTTRATTVDRKSVVDGLERTRQAIYKVDAMLGVLSNHDDDVAIDSMLIDTYCDTMRDLLGPTCESIDNAWTMLEQKSAGGAS